MITRIENTISRQLKLAIVLFLLSIFITLCDMNLKINRNVRIELYFRRSGDNDHIPSLVADDSIVSSVNLPFERPSRDQSILLVDCITGDAQQLEMFSKKKVRLNNLMMQFGYQAHALCLGFAQLLMTPCMVVPK